MRYVLNDLPINSLFDTTTVAITQGLIYTRGECDGQVSQHKHLAKIHSAEGGWSAQLYDGLQHVMREPLCITYYPLKGKVKTMKQVVTY